MSAITVFEAAWTVATSPKTVVATGALAGDILLVLAGGDDFEPGSDTTVATITTTAGTTQGWAEAAKQLTGASADWIMAGWTQVTADGDVTVSVARTQSGTAGAWGFYALRIRGSAGIGAIASDFVADSGQTVSLTVSRTGSAVAFLAVDWDAAAVGTVWVPAAGVTAVERTASAGGNYSLAAAYWASEAAGIRAYGTTGMAGTKIRCIAVEIMEPGVAAESAKNSSAMAAMMVGGY